MDKKEARRRGYGDIWDVMLTDEESDEPIGKVPEVPENLLEKTLKATARASHFEVERYADPARIPTPIPIQYQKDSLFVLFVRFKDKIRYLRWKYNLL